MANETRKRRPFVAALLSLLLMGAGQLYNGQLRRAFVFLALTSSEVALAFAMAALVQSFSGFLIVSAWATIALGLRVFAAIDAFIGARKVGAIELRRYNRWYVYGALLLAAAAVQLQQPSEYGFASYSFPTASMAPTILPGDYVIADTIAYRNQRLQRGDVIFFVLPAKSQAAYVKRIIGFPGDRIQVRDGILLINGAEIQRELLGTRKLIGSLGARTKFKEYLEFLPNNRGHHIFEQGDNLPLDNTPVYRVPSGQYFVLGDNRDGSLDSRSLEDVGYVPAANIIGVPRYVFWAKDFSRIGAVVQ